MMNGTVHDVYGAGYFTRSTTAGKMSADIGPSTELFGVTLMSAALLLNEGEKESATTTKKRWHNSGKLPVAIGKNASDTQEYIFEPSALAGFIIKMRDNIFSS